MTLLTDYALEVGARITYSVEPAELKPEGSRKYDTWKAARQMQVTSEWSNGDITVGNINVEIKVSRQKPDHDGSRKVTVMGLWAELLLGAQMKTWNRKRSWLDERQQNYAARPVK